MEHFWVVMTAPEGRGDDVDGVVSDAELEALQRQGYTLRGQTPAFKADVVSLEATA